MGERIIIHKTSTLEGEGTAKTKEPIMQTYTAKYASFK